MGSANNVSAGNFDRFPVLTGQCLSETALNDKDHLPHSLQLPGHTGQGTIAGWCLALGAHFLLERWLWLLNSQPVYGIPGQRSLQQGGVLKSTFFPWPRSLGEGDVVVEEDGEGDARFPNSSRANEGEVLDVDGFEGGFCIGAVSTLPWVTALTITEHDITTCGRVKTELGPFFKFFTRGSVNSSDFDAWTFVRDPETSVEGADCRETCVEAAGSCGICDSAGPEVVEGVFCPCRCGTMAGEA